MIQKKIIMKKIITKFSEIIVHSLLAFILVLSGNLIPYPSVNAEENNDEININGQLLHFERSEESGIVTVRTLNHENSVLSEIYYDENCIYSINNGVKTIIATVDINTASSDLSPYAIEPSWGPLLSQTVNINYNNTATSTVDQIIALLISVSFPGLSVPYSVARIVATAMLGSKYTTVKYTAYYHEAIGCPQYRWYKRYVYYSPSGSVINSQTVNQKSFIGVRNSPENPPSCRAYGF